MKRKKMLLVVITLVLTGPILVLVFGKVNLSTDWRNADRSSQGLAPRALETQEAIVQVYAARAFSWRGIFAVHTWIATKPVNALEYTVHQVVGWREWRQQRVVVSETDLPDRSWYGNPPIMLADYRGAQAGALIPAIEKAVASYPNQFSYTLWPGPNSNTFIAHIARRVPALRLELPTTAIGKDFLPIGRFFASAPSGTGWQFSLYGILGLLLARDEGLEVNILSANFAVDPFGPSIKLPGIGRIGFE